MNHHSEIEGEHEDDAQSDDEDQTEREDLAEPSALISDQDSPIQVKFASISVPSQKPGVKSSSCKFVRTCHMPGVFFHMFSYMHL